MSFDVYSVRMSRPNHPVEGCSIMVDVDDLGNRHMCVRIHTSIIHDLGWVSIDNVDVGIGAGEDAGKIALGWNPLRMAFRQPAIIDKTEQPGAVIVDLGYPPAFQKVAAIGWTSVKYTLDVGPMGSSLFLETGITPDEPQGT